MSSGFGPGQSPFGGQGYGMPFDDDNMFVVGDRRGRRVHQDPNSPVVKRESGVFHEKLGSIIGPAYIGAFGFGMLYGLTKTPPPRARRTWRLAINNYLNEVGKTSSRWANQTAACVFLYVLAGKCINYIFFEELEHLPDSSKAAIYGIFTGALYKSTRGWRASIFGSFLGALSGYSFASFWEYRMKGRKFEL